MRLVMGGESLEGPLTGIGQYTYHLAKGMLASPDIEDFKFLAHGRLRDPSALMAGGGSADSEVTENQKPSRLNAALGLVRAIYAQNEAAIALYKRLIPRLERHSLRHYGPTDVYHSPNYMLPEFPGKTVVSILDLSTYRYPEHHPETRVRFVNQHIEKAIKHADHIITISNLVKTEIVERFGYPEDRITVTYLGADDAFRPLSENEFLKESQSLNLAYKGYFLFVSSIEPRKNLDRLLDAYLAYRSNCTTEPLPFIVTGIPGWKSQDLHARLNHLEARSDVHYLGYVDQSLLPTLMAGARALLYPSLYEGFGLPMLEAMQSGTAVITSQETAMAEIGGDAMRQVDPQNTGAMAEAIANLANDVEAAHSLSHKGIEQAKQFSWQRCAEQTLAAYHATAHRESIN
ncbi:glycosyltransferase family 4 protein [Luminiphilus sp.]|nr:glycosyltransferase family 4 protein [Luminiphilus sp.]